jgi:hypothetical protein
MLLTWGDKQMELDIWLPGLLVLGLFLMGLMFAFAVACEKV